MPTQTEKFLESRRRTLELQLEKALRRLNSAEGAENMSEALERVNDLRNELEDPMPPSTLPAGEPLVSQASRRAARGGPL